ARIAGGLEEGGALLHPGFQSVMGEVGLTAGAGVDIERLEAGIFRGVALDGVGGRDVPDVTERDPLVDETLELVVGRVAEPDPFERGRSEICAVFLNPFRGVERAGRQITRTVRYEHGADHVVAVVADID